MNTRATDVPPTRPGPAELGDADLLSVIQSLPRGDSRRDAACEVLVNRYQPLVRSCVLRYKNSTEPQEELMQVGYVGLLKATNNFDVRLVTSLAGYAQPCVSGEIKRHFRDKRWQIRVHRSLQELRLEVRSRITFAGEVAQADRPALLRSADLLVSASPVEHTGAAAIQAMACGTPVVVAGVGAHNDAVVDGVTGLLIEPEHPAMLAHRVRALLARPVFLAALGIAAADRAQSRYSVDRIGRETVATYEWCRHRRAAAQSGPAAEDVDEADDSAAELRGVAGFG